MKLIEWPYYRKEFLASQGLSPTFVSRFWAKVVFTDQCWVWSASRYLWGYGQLGRWKEGDPPIGAHVASWILHFGPIPKGFCVLHTCDNPPCVRPSHLWLGTIMDNTQDMMQKGRQVIGTRYRGEQHSNSVLTTAQVLSVRQRYATGCESQQAIADSLGVSQTLVSAIVRCVVWKHVA